MKTYDSGYQGKKKRVSKKREGGLDHIQRMVASLSNEKFQKMMDQRSSPASDKKDKTGRNIFNKIQAKLEISQPQDASEVQADKLAEGVTTGNTQLSKSALSNNPVSEVNPKSEGFTMQTSNAFDSSLQSTKGQGQKLDNNTRAELEQHTGTDLSGVNIHTSSQANKLSESINAKAFTHGQDVYFKQGQYHPESKDGKQLLAHEIAHTVQQSGGKVQPKIQRQDDKKKADKTGNKSDVDSKPKFHRTVKGDTYGKISQKYGVSIENLREWNGYPDKKIPIGVDIYLTEPSKEIVLWDAGYRAYAEYVYWKLRKSKGRNFKLTDKEAKEAVIALPESWEILKAIIYVQNWIDQRDTKVGKMYEGILGENIGKLTPDQIVSIQDARNQSIKDIQVDWWLHMIPVAFSWLSLTYGPELSPLKTRMLKIPSTITSTVGFGTGDAQIITYKAAQAITKGSKGAIQGHHLVESRFLKLLKMDLGAAPAVILTRTEHQVITNVLRNLLPYGTKNVTKQMLINSYKIAYRQYPTWIKAIENHLK